MARLLPRMRRLRDESRETVILGRPQAGWRGVLYLEVLEGPQTIRYSAAAGDVKPLHSSSIGKALLSNLDAARLEAVLAKLRLERVTRNTITKKAKLKADIESGLRRGHQMTAGENVADVAGIAAPLARMEGQLRRLTGLLAEAISELNENQGGT